MPISGRLLRIREVASLCNVSRQAVGKWIKEGKVGAVRLPSGRYRIPESELVRVLQVKRPRVAKEELSPPATAKA